MLETFQSFVKDIEAPEAFILGVAGTGKTTSLAELVIWALKHNKAIVVCAYTHQAVKVLRSKLPAEVEDKFVICTLHSYLKKRPTVNDKALEIKDVDGNVQVSLPNLVDFLFIDEFSQVGERDKVSINTLQYDDEGHLLTKVIYIGDPNQLPPVKDQVAVIPNGQYQIKLTKIHRQADDSPLIDTLLKLNDYINGKKAQLLEEHSALTRNQDIINLYKNCNTSKVLLAYTNAQVEYLNSTVQGRHAPLLGDELFSPTIRRFYTLENHTLTSDAIITIRGDLLELQSKYKTLETLHELDVQFFTLMDEHYNISPRAVVFGHDSYLQMSQQLAKRAVASNKKIEKEFKMDAKDWANANWSQPLAKERSKAWKQYLAFKDCVICIDFVHAMTVHKSQGSTYENVFLDIQDIGKCADKDFQLYLKLLYVGISRASKRVYTN